MMASGAYWNKSPSSLPDSIRESIRVKSINTVNKIFDACVTLSPVDTGAYRASWTLSPDSPEDGWVGRQQRNGNVLPRPVRPQFSASKHYTQFFISNFAPYSVQLEYGHSAMQAPLGVLRQAMRSVV